MIKQVAKSCEMYDKPLSNPAVADGRFIAFVSELLDILSKRFVNVVLVFIYMHGPTIGEIHQIIDLILEITNLAVNVLYRNTLIKGLTIQLTG